MWHCRMMVIAAALAMAACDSSGPGTEPVPTTDTSELGKVDDPSQPDTSVSDSGGDMNNSEASTPDVVAYTAENLCPDLLPMVDTWYAYEYENVVLEAWIEIDGALCILKVESPELLNAILVFERSSPPPLFYVATIGGVTERSKIFLENQHLILEVYDEGADEPYARIVFHQ